MKKALVLMLVALMLVACGPNPAEFWNSELHPLVVEFANQIELSSNTPREALSPVISQMVSINTRIEVLSESDAVPDCAVAGLAQILVATASVIDAAEDWVSVDSSWSEGEWEEHDRTADTAWLSADELLATALVTTMEDCRLTSLAD